MGILKTMVKTGGNDDGNNGGKTYTGGHAINLDKVMTATDANVINPMQPGNFASIRSQNVVTTPRYYSQEELKQLKAEANQKTQGAANTRKAYKALERIEAADTKVHQAHRRYEGKIADGELTKKRSDAKLARKLHTQRPQYTQMGRSIEKADSKASTRILQLTTQIEAMM